jgi:hypothetical protein
MEIQTHIDGLYSAKTDINLSVLKKTVYNMYEIIKVNFQNNQNHTAQITLDTNLHTKYNLLLYPLPGIHDLYFAISKVFHACSKFSNVGLNEKYFIQCWLNFYNKGDFIDWHHHTNADFNCWHGFLCVDTEPESYTSYKWPMDLDRKNLIIDVPSKDGTIVMGRSNGDLHRSSEWTFTDRPRITIAFDIVPARFISGYCVKDNPEPKYLNAMKNSSMYVNHWIPI